MTTTRSGLVAAKMINLGTNEEVLCMFNPHEYTLTKTNNWADQPNIGRNTPRANYKQGGPQTLKLTLHFDTLEQRDDVRNTTDALWRMMMIDDSQRTSSTQKVTPPKVAFEWGRFYFRAVIKNMTQKYTLFLADGTPVRCEVSITLEQKEDVSDYKDGLVPDGASDAVREVAALAGSRVDNMIAGAGGDASSDMRRVLEDNNIDDPFNVPSGSPITIRR